MEFDEIAEKLSAIDSLKLKISYIFGYFLRKFLEIAFPYFIFIVNTIFFYLFGHKDILSLASWAIFFAMSMVFYFIVRRIG